MKKYAAKLFDNSVGHALENQKEFARKRSLFFAMEHAATAETMEFLHDRARTASYFPSRMHLLSFALTKVEEPGLYIELGAKRGVTINHIAKEAPGATIHGFDSFIGFPSAWEGSAKVLHMNLRDGSLPEVAPNVKLYKGWFNETLPPFIAEHDENIAFLHVDCDIYASTKTSFECLGHKLTPGSVLVFDEYFNYWGWQNHEHKAFEEFLARTGFAAEYLGFSEQQLAVTLKSRE